MSSTITAITLPEVDEELAQARVRVERGLLVIAGAFILINQVALIIARDRSWTALWPVAVWAVCAAVGHTLLQRRLPLRDPLFFPLAMFLTGWGPKLNLAAGSRATWKRQTLLAGPLGPGCQCLWLNRRGPGKTSPGLGFLIR